MSWKPIASTVPQYHTAGAPASGYYLKAYQAGTTTAVNMATDTGGGTTLAKVQLNAEGYPINGSSAIFIPYIGISNYKLALYLNATDADNNTTGSAAWVIDNISIDLANTTTYELGSVAAAQSHNGISTGHLVTTNYYDTNRVAGSGGTFRFTGTTTVGKAGNWSDADGYFYDADGKQFMCIESSVKAWGCRCNGTTDDTTALKAAVAVACTRVANGELITIVIPETPYITDTVTVTVSGAGRAPDVDCQGLIHYGGTNTKPALVIGEDGEVIFSADLNIAITNDNQSDWTDASCVGVRLINLNSCSNVNIQEATNFTIGVQCYGLNAGFSYNNLFLGSLLNNQYGVDLFPGGTGWTNENTLTGGRYSVLTGVNNTTARYGARVGRSGASEANNNVFIKPSFEMNQSETGAGLTFGITLFDAVQNTVIACRSEGTEIVAVFDSGSTENLVEIGYSDANSHGVTDGGPAGNIVRYSRLAAEYYSKSVFEIDDIRDRATINSSTLGTIPGLISVDTTTGAISNQTPAITLGTEDVTITSATRALGIIIDTSEVKQFILSPGYTGTDGGRLFVQCYTAADVLLTGTSPAYAIGPSSAALSTSGQGYRSGSDSTANRPVRFHADVKRAFIGLVRGSSNIDLNSFRIFSVDDTDYVGKAAVLQKTPSAGQAPNFRYSDQAPTAGTWRVGDRVYNTAPSVDGNNMVLDHWTCTVAGTPGTWVAQYLSTVTPAT